MDLTQLIGNIGFPAVMCLLMYHMSTKSLGELTKSMSTMEVTLSTLKASIDMLAEKIKDHYKEDE